jgi:MinD superfamily P-loop ATPase
MPVQIDLDLCCVCGGCVDVCASDALVAAGIGIRVVAEKCTGCGTCVGECPIGALNLLA